MRNILSDTSGSFSVAMAVSLVPLLAFSGVAVDYVRAATLRQKLQASVDTAALAGAAANTPDAAGKVLALARDNMQVTLATDRSVSGFSVTGQWLSPTDFETVASASIANSILTAVPGLPKASSVSVRAVARLYQPIVAGAPPRVSQLDPEAGDYNQTAVYCYDPTKRLEASRGRSLTTVIADNGGTTYSFTMPTCPQGATLSYKLRNVRNMRTTPARWNDPLAEQYEYFSDTTLEGYRQTYNFGPYEILETVLCDTLEQCKPRSHGGVLPEGKNRTAQTATAACSPGKFMYYGWEDRPPNYGWTDRDYDDIRVIVECPTITRGARQVFLLR